MAMDWLRNKIADLRDTVADVRHDVTEQFVRCPSTHNNAQCANDKGHGGSHEDEVGNTW